MSRGIIIFGAPGSGTSTVGRALAKHLGFTHFETDDFSGIRIDSPPFRISRTLEERTALLHTELSKCSNFVISGSMWDWGTSFIPLFDLAVFITTPTDVRIERLEKREHEKHGNRIGINGDMYDSHRQFIEWAKTYDTDNPDRSLKLHEQWIETLTCPVLRISGATPISENVMRISERYEYFRQLKYAERERVNECEKIGKSSDTRRRNTRRRQDSIRELFV